MQDSRPISHSPFLPKITAELAATQNQLYGQSLNPVTLAAGSISIQFQKSTASEVGIELHLWCAGTEFQLQIVDPHAVLDLGAVLVPEVPAPLQSAAFLYAAQPIWQVLEKSLGCPVQLISLIKPRAASSHNEVLGFLISVLDGATGERRQSGASLKALQPQGWEQLIAKVTPRLTPKTETLDFSLEFSVQCQPIAITLWELSSMAAGDVLLLDGSSEDLGKENVYLVLSNIPIIGLQAVRSDGRVQMTHVGVPENGRSRVNLEHLWSESVTTDDNATTFAADSADSTSAIYRNAVDDLQVQIELELGKLSMPISSLRNLAVGQVFNMQKPVDGEIVGLSCGGKRLGVGQLVAIGDRLGVRITSLETPPRENGIEATRSSARQNLPSDSSL